jgi:serine/threonine protein kinase
LTHFWPGLAGILQPLATYDLPLTFKDVLDLSQESDMPPVPEGSAALDTGNPICQVFQSCTTDLEFLLQNLEVFHGTLTFLDRLGVIYQLLLLLLDLLTCGIAHRDFKPSNILLQVRSHVVILSCTAILCACSNQLLRFSPILCCRSWTTPAHITAPHRG